MFYFKGQEGNSHGDGKQMFAGTSLKVGHREDFDPIYLAVFLTITH